MSTNPIKTSSVPIVEYKSAPTIGGGHPPKKIKETHSLTTAAITKLMFNDIVDHHRYSDCVGTIIGGDDDDEDPHDYDDYECEESGNCTKCCEIGECTSKHAFSNQGQWGTDVGLYLSCPHCEPFGGAERPVMSNERYDCKGILELSTPVS